MFMKTGRKYLGPVLFSPGAKTRLAAMSILSTLFPLALSVSAQALAAPAPVVVEPVVAVPVTAAPVTAPWPSRRPRPRRGGAQAGARRREAGREAGRCADREGAGPRRAGSQRHHRSRRQGDDRHQDRPGQFHADRSLGRARQWRLLHQPSGQGPLRVHLARADVHRVRWHNGFHRGAQAQGV